MKRNLTKALLTLASGLFMLPAGIGKANAAESTSVWVGGVELTDGQYLASNSTTPVTTQPETGGVRLLQ